MRLGRCLAALVVATTLLNACGSESSDEGESDESGDAPGRPPTRVVATGPDGEVVQFTDFSVTCRPSEEEQPPAQIVYALAGFGDADNPSRPKGPAMMIEAADTVDGMTVELPHIEEYGNEKTFVSAFITEVGDEREIASNTELSTGEIEVISATCEPTPRLEVRIDGVMESELSDNTVTVQGYVVAE
ncbi:hypothetical protein [Nocardioides silvaticus]|uniref:hypothetical protein n=1 Tax=Nocardioides silvaticus TaxID=2201891 RepID=UPI0011B21212|nr:hypothetical protein [Nocardioides silvaticus]